MKVDDHLVRARQFDAAQPQLDAPGRVKKDALFKPAIRRHETHLTQILRNIFVAFRAGIFVNEVFLR
ncbi:MAG: hypothetical protein ALAOOOJD_03021 [bacterium]|nr:hypothetical protein [bacterium]